MTEETMTTTTAQEKQQQIQTYYCEVCGIDTSPDTNLKRFGKLFCSDTHLNLYVRTRQRKLGLTNNDDNNNSENDYSEIKGQGEPVRNSKRRRWFSGGGGCC